MRVKIKVDGQLHRTLKKMDVFGETRFSRLRSSSWSGWNLQKLLEYGLMHRKAGQDFVPDTLDQVLGVLPRISSNRGKGRVVYSITEQGQRVLEELNTAETYYLQTSVKPNEGWRMYFLNHTW